MKKCKKIYLFFFSLFTFFFFIFIIELTFYLLIMYNPNSDCILSRFSKEKDFPLTNFYIHEDNIGYKGNPGETMYEVIANVTYSLDKYGRRISPTKENKSPLLLFGGSFVFGHRLADNETIGYFLSKYTDYRVYNYGFQGYGTQHMLSDLERDDFQSEIENKKGLAIYFFISHHVRRVIGDMKVYNEWGYDMPFYYINDKCDVDRKGSFTTGRKFISTLYSVLGKSSLFKYFNINLPPYTKKHDYLTFKIIEKSKKLYEEKFDGDFYVFFYPNNKNPYIIKLLNKNNISYISLEEDLEEKYGSKDYYLEDGHPTSILNELIASYISNITRLR
jgi:hypothetical protein